MSLSEKLKALSESQLDQLEAYAGRLSRLEKISAKDMVHMSHNFVKAVGHPDVSASQSYVLYSLLVEKSKADMQGITEFSRKICSALAHDRILRPGRNNTLKNYSAHVAVKYAEFVEQTKQNPQWISSAWLHATHVSVEEKNLGVANYALKKHDIHRSSSIQDDDKLSHVR